MGGKSVRGLRHENDDDKVVEELQRPDGAVPKDFPMRTRWLPQVRPQPAQNVGASHGTTVTGQAAWRTSLAASDPTRR